VDASSECCTPTLSLDSGEGDDRDGCAAVTSRGPSLVAAARLYAGRASADQGQVHGSAAVRALRTAARASLRSRCLLPVRGWSWRPVLPPSGRHPPHALRARPR